MKLDAPFSLDLAIQLNLTAAQANGNLGTLAAGPLPVSSKISKLNAKPPFTLILPQGDIIASTSSRNTSGTNNDCTPRMFNNNSGDLTSLTYVWVNGPLATWYCDLNIVGVYNNGAAGVGATLTTALANVPYALPMGGNVANGDHVVIMGQNSQNENGLYVVSGVGVAVVFTRSADADSAVEVHNGVYGGFTNSSDFIWFVTGRGTPFGVGPIQIGIYQANDVGAAQGDLANACNLNQAITARIGLFTDLLALGLYDSTAQISLIVMPLPFNPSALTNPLTGAHACDYEYILTKPFG